MKAGLSEEVRALLRCPETGQALREATVEELVTFEADLPEGGFITEDGTRVYPIRDGFPMLVVDEAVERTAS